MKKAVKWAALVAALVALLAADALIARAWTLKGIDKGVEAAAPASLAAVDPLDQFRLERDQLRARQVAQLNDIIYSDKSDAQTVARAQAQLLSLMQRQDAEVTLEGLLQGRGLEGALVSVGERSANVLLRREFVTQQESAVILELVMRETGVTGGNVKIIPVF